LLEAVAGDDEGWARGEERGWLAGGHCGGVSMLMPLLLLLLPRDEDAVTYSAWQIAASTSGLAL